MEEKKEAFLRSKSFWQTNILKVSVWHHLISAFLNFHLSIAALALSPGPSYLVSYILLPSRYGDEHKLAGFSATLQAIISFVEDGYITDFVLANYIYIYSMNSSLNILQIGFLFELNLQGTFLIFPFCFQG